MKLIIPDKFRGTLSAAEAASAISEGLGGKCLCLPMADGGEGTAAALPGLNVIESASVIGHGSPTHARHILHRSSYDLGSAIKKALETQTSDIYIAVGGTVTADGGTGMLQALGARFLDKHCHVIENPLCPQNINHIAYADFSSLESISARLYLLADVEASLTGPGLSALDFLRQKGAESSDIIIIRKALAHLQKICGGQSPYDGCGGGIGYALASLIGCRASLGAEFVLRHMPVDWSEINLVATGEGCIDHQSIGGKTVGCIIRECEKRKKTVVAFGGRVDSEITDSRCIEVSPKSPTLPNPEEAYAALREAAENWIKKQPFSFS
ncbi:MAG: glycerate kinase [Muribaculaceae bacterium]|nr:glycerate kinase [Muribaculaceae bacterium]